MTGYLTLSRDDEPLSGEADCSASEGKLALRIPNEEIKGIFKKTVVEWFKKSVQTVDRSAMFGALRDGDAKKAERAVSDLLFATISYNDYQESFYHAFVAGLFAGAGYIVRSNCEYGDGRPDVVIKDRSARRVMVFEVKHASEGETLTHAVNEAVNQISDRRCAEPFLKEGYRSVIGYGIVFKGKDCEIEKCE